MALQFVLGQAGSGKSEYCIKKALLAEAEKKRVIMIVPEQYSHQGEGAFLKERGYIHDDFLVTSFGRLAKRLIADSGISRQTMDSAGKAMLTLRAVNQCKGALKFFRSSAENQGYLRLFTDAISEFKKGQVTPESLFAIAEKTADPLFAARLFDLACIYEAYNKLLSDSVADSDDDLTLAASLCFDSAYIKNAEILIDEFYRFTQNELAFITAFLAAGASVTVSLCMPSFVAPNSVFQSVYRSKKALEKCAENAGVSVCDPIVLEKSVRYISSELSHLEQALSYKTSPWENTPTDITLSIAKGKYEEVVALAATIRKYVAETGAAYRDVAVITGDYDGYSDLIQSIFPLYDIPIFADTRQDFLAHPIVLYLFSVFDLLAGIRTKHVVAYMKSGFADITDIDAFRLENYALSTALEYGDWLNDARFLQKANGVFDTEETCDGTDLLAAKNRLLEPILSLKEQMGASKTIHDRIASLISFLEATRLQEKIQQQILGFREQGNLRLADEYAEVYNILIETLQTMAQLLGNETAGISAIRSILEAGLAQKSIGVIPSVYDHVAFGDLNRSVIKNVRALFIVGVNDGCFPPIPTTNALLSDSEREFLLLEGISVTPDAKKRIADGEFSIYSAVTLCREKLFLSYPVADDSGSGLRPAMLVQKLKRIFPNLAALCDLDTDEPRPENTVASKQSAYTYVLTHMRTLSENKLAETLYKTLQNDEHYGERLRRAEAFLKYQNTAGRLSKDTISRLYGNSLYGSVSRFERFAVCPFSFFIEYGLKAKERKVLKVEAPDIGSLLHEIIERFSKEMVRQKKSFRTITATEQREITDALIDEMFSAMFIKNIYSAGRLEALKKRLKSLVSKSVWAICRHVAMGKFEPAAFEIAFDKNGELPPVTVPLPDGSTLTMRGRIDRIDTFSHNGMLYLKVIDYKSGAKGYSLADIFNGTTLQLAVYMVAATEGFSANDNANTGFGGMFYFRLDDPVADGAPETEPNEADALKVFKMSGLVSDDPSVARAMDDELEGWSAVIPVYLKADGTISKSQSKTASLAQFDDLKRYMKRTLSKIGQEIMNGNVDISPMKSAKSLPCTYCKYLSVCGFDPNTNHCRKAEQFSSDEEIWEQIQETVSG